MYRLVVIDDEYIVVEGIKAMIQRQQLGYEVVGAAYDGITALEVIRSTRPDLVITDLRIPGMDGLSVIEAAREFCPDTAFVVISGYTEFAYAQRALSLGVLGYIDKPISVRKLTATLEDVKNRHFKARKKQDEYVRKAENVKELSEILETSISALINEDVPKLHASFEEMMTRIQETYAEFADYKREVYKSLCVLCDVMKEKQKDISREDLVSYRQIDQCGDMAAVCTYADQVEDDLERFLEAGKTGSRHGTVLKLLSYIEQNYNKDIGLTELAEMGGISTAYLSILFKSEVGMSYVKYLTRIRMERAKELLRQEYKVYEVSEMVGYHNYRYFSDTFKKYEGQTPKDYKAKVWGKEEVKG